MYLNDNTITSRVRRDGSFVPELLFCRAGERVLVRAYRCI